MTVISLADDSVYTVTKQYKAAANALDNARDIDDKEYYRRERCWFDAYTAFHACVPATPDGLKAKIATFLNVGDVDPHVRTFLETVLKSIDLIAANQKPLPECELTGAELVPT